jgi:3'-phosphoadenosine 5'-phosphosulfate sulfotransferase (PAPS reductase)/FAD synthetase
MPHRPDRPDPSQSALGDLAASGHGGCPAGDASAVPISRQLAEAVRASHAILDEALNQISAEGNELTAVCVLFSGGHDSTALLHLMRERATHAVHINTGIGIPQTRDFVHTTTQAAGLPLIEVHPPDSYDDLVLGNVCARSGRHAGQPIWRGFPGPAGHHFMYDRLKDRPLRQVRSRFIHTPRTQRLVFLSGMRRSESARRRRNAKAIDRVGSIVWVCPLIGWTTPILHAYQRTHAVPRNEVADLLHMSGECLCGSFARPGELAEIGFWFPDTARRIHRLQAQVRARGISACRWGQRPPGKNATPPGPLCTGCTSRFEDDSDLPVHDWAANPALTRHPRPQNSTVPNSAPRLPGDEPDGR